MHQEASVRVENEDGDVLAGGVVPPAVLVFEAAALVGAVDARGGGRLRAGGVHFDATKRTEKYIREIDEMSLDCQMYP